MSIKIKTIRVSGFRGLKNIEVTLEQNTILTGMNNTGKTSLLKALQLVFGNRQFISQDDFFIQGSNVSEKIVIDLLIIPINDNGEQCEDFLEDWEILFTTDRIQNDDIGKSFIPLRTVLVFDEIKNSYRTQQFILHSWPELKQDGVNWFEAEDGNKTNFYFEEIPFFYVSAQRDILEDIKLRNSYLGKMLSKIEYSPEAIEEIEKQIKSLNEKTVSSSDILSNIKHSLKELDTAMDTSSEGIEVTPFTKKLRDLNKGLTIYYTDQQDSFSMEYHGMGTRSWSSLLTLKAFISLLTDSANKAGSVFYPILAIEEPEAHLHPNAQKKLYGQMDAIVGQKFISTHSPYIAASAKLKQIRSLYKNNAIVCGQIDTDSLTLEDIRKINRQVINTRGEIFFSKMIVFFEGETEEQALPVFFQKHFSSSSVEMGLDFVGVGGHGNYLPFIRFSESLNIPWIIFSDAENTPDKNIKKSVQDQVISSETARNEEDCVVFLDDGSDFEKQLINDGFQDEIKQAIIEQGVYQNEKHKQVKITEINAYDDTTLYGVLTGDKTRYGVLIAEKIIQGEKPLPPKIVALFSKISATFNT